MEAIELKLYDPTGYQPQIEFTFFFEGKKCSLAWTMLVRAVDLELRCDGEQLAVCNIGYPPAREYAQLIADAWSAALAFGRAQAINGRLSPGQRAEMASCSELLDSHYAMQSALVRFARTGRSKHWPKRYTRY